LFKFNVAFSLLAVLKQTYNANKRSILTQNIIELTLTIIIIIIIIISIRTKSTNTEKQLTQQYRL